MEKSYLLNMTEEQHKELKIKAAMLGIDLKELLIEGAKQYNPKKEEK